jgi:hypothetical protein
MLLLLTKRNLDVTSGAIHEDTPMKSQTKMAVKVFGGAAALIIAVGGGGIVAATSTTTTAGTTNAPVQLVDTIHCQSDGIHGQTCPVR